MHWLTVLLLIGLVVLMTVPALSAPAPGFLKKGDTWVFLGDSITDAGTYVRTVQRVCQFYHPNDNIIVKNNGSTGSLAVAVANQLTKATETVQPTMVCIMTGMNNTINSNWRQGMPTQPNIDDYATTLRNTTRTMQAKGLTVVLLGPTYTDESPGWAPIWELAGTRGLLEAYSGKLAEIAKEEKAIFLPVGAEFEAYQQTLKPEQVLRPDGVHPSAGGQYQIARTIIHHLNLAGPLEGTRQALDTPVADCPVDLTLDTRRLSPTAMEIPVTASTATPGEYTFTWSYKIANTISKKETKTITLTGHDQWNLPLPSALPQDAGKVADVLLEVSQGESRRLYIIDLAAVPVLHPVDGVITGILNTPKDRPEIKQVASWKISIAGKSMIFEADVNDAQINDDSFWPWGRDGVTLWLDIRPNERFADVGLDSDVYQTLLNVHDKPIFGATVLSWIGRNMGAASIIASEKTPTGYQLHFALQGQLSKFNTFDASNRDFIGICPVVVDATGANNINFHEVYTPERQHDHYANSLMIVDLKNKITGDKVVNVAITKL